MNLFKSCILLFIFLNSYLYKTVQDDHFNSTLDLSTEEAISNVDLHPNSRNKNFSSDSLSEDKLRNNNKSNREESNKVKVLKYIGESLWKYIPPILMTTGIIGNTLTVVVLRR